jgi:hypothetical protein
MRKKIFFFTFIFLVSTLCTEAQSPLSIRLHKGSGEDATVMNLFPNQNMRSDFDLAGVAWSISGNSYICRGYFKFFLDFIPQGTLIDSARLTFFGNPSPQHSPGHSNYSGSDACFIKRVTSNWYDTSITWNNQPPSTNQNEISLPQSNSSMQDYPNIDVTTAVIDMINNPTSNYGFVLQLQTELHYRSLDFASGDCTDSTKWPKLDIYLTLVGVKRISNEIPEEFFLYQNFPNPFNPTTKIKYDISKSENVKLEVYNVLGKEIKILVNSLQEAGKYEITWDALNFTSGVYFYKLTTADFTETKRMVLVK